MGLILKLGETNNMSDTKVCNTCGIEKELTEFHKSTFKGNNRGRGGQCKICRIPISREASRQQNFKKYGITEQIYIEMMAEQNNVCSICGEPETSLSNIGNSKAMAIDHCHDTGRVRGLLCSNCNKALGLFKDNIDVMASAISYLKQK